MPVLLRHSRHITSKSRINCLSVGQRAAGTGNRQAQAQAEAGTGTGNRQRQARGRDEEQAESGTLYGQVFINAGARLLCTSDGVCVIVSFQFSSVGAGMVFLGRFFSSFWDRIWVELDL